MHPPHPLDCKFHLANDHICSLHHSTASLCTSVGWDSINISGMNESLHNQNTFCSKYFCRGHRFILEFSEYVPKFCSDDQGLTDISKVLEISLMKCVWSGEQNLCAMEIKFTSVAERKTDSCHQQGALIKKKKKRVMKATRDSLGLDQCRKQRT